MDNAGCENSLKQPAGNGVWFVYGSLKPRELGFRQIEHLVDHNEPARVDGYRIWIRDGLPGILEGHEHDWVDGYLLYVKEGKETELQSVIKEFEREVHYKFSNVEVSNSSDICVTATATCFKKSHRGDDAFDRPTWSISDDVYFRYGLPTLFKTVHESKEDGGPSDSIDFWRDYLPLVGSYMNLWTVLERYIQFTQPGLKSNPNNEAKGDMRDLRAIELSEAGKKAYDKVIHKNKDRPQPSRDYPRDQNSDRYFTYWRIARNNSVHRGKSAHSDYRLVRNAALGLSEFLVALLSQEVDGLEFEDLGVTSPPSIS